MLFFAGVTAILCVFGLGLLWPHRAPLPLGAMIWGYFVKALYLSWIWFLISFHSDLGDGARLIALTLFAFAAFRLVRGDLPGVTAPDAQSRFKHLRHLIMAIAFIAITSPAIVSFGTIFHAWDAVASWNRWAIELSGNKYAPMNAAYPILWPAIWSLIYEAQNSSAYWYVTKATAAVPLFALALIVVDQINRAQILSGILLAVLVALCISSQRYFVVSGYMDMPLAMMGLAALLLIITAAEETSADRRSELFMFAVLTSAMAMVTKQPGILFAGVVGLCALYETLKKRMPVSRLLVYGAIVFFPLVSFLLIYLGVQDDPFGNFGQLTNVADKARGEAGKFAFAVSMFNTSMPGTIWPVLLPGIILNAIFFRSYRGAIGLISLAAGIVTFVLFVNYFAYNLRNGYLILSFATASAFVGYSSAEAWATSRLPISLPFAAGEKLLSSRAPLAAALTVILVFLSMLSIEWPEERLARVDPEVRYRSLGTPSVNSFLRANAKTIEKAPAFVSSYQMAGYLPLASGKFFLCHQTDAACIERLSTRHKGKEVALLSVGFRENPQTLALLEDAVTSGKATIVAQRDGLTLYTFKVE